MQIEIKRLSETAIIPSKAHSTDAAFDLYADCPNAQFCLWNDDDDLMLNGIEILPNTTVVINTGFAFAIPNNYFGGIYARSGLATKEGLRPANCVGVVDSGYRGEIKVALHNDSNKTKIIHHGDRIAQLIIQPYPDVELIEVENLNNTDRGIGGFGSTGTN